MKKFFTPLCFFLFCISGSVFGQSTMLNDFEPGSPTNVSRYGLVSNVATVSNPFPGGFNSTANCARVSRTTSNWYELFAFPVNFTVPANTKKYVHMLVNYYAQPDISIRINNQNVNSDAGEPFRSLNKYTNLGQWQDLVFEIDGGSTGVSVNAILVHPDAGFENVPSGQILNNTDKFGYMDEILLSDSATLLSVNKLEKSNSIAIYPNPANEFLTISNLQSDTILSIVSLDGKTVYQNKNNKNDTTTLSVKEWTKGAYIVRIQNGSESIVKKIIID